MKKYLFTLLLIMLIAVVGCSNNSTTQPKEDPKDTEPVVEQPQVAPVNIPQLSEDRADAATMVLITAPTLQPADHAGRWNPDLGMQSCLMCHEQAEAMGAREIPLDHFNDQDRSKGIFGARNSCVTCHGLDSGDARPGFNR